MSQPFYTTTDGTVLQKVEEVAKPDWHDAYESYYGDVLVCCEVVATQPHVHNVSVGSIRYYDKRYLYTGSPQ